MQDDLDLKDEINDDDDSEFVVNPIVAEVQAGIANEEVKKEKSRRYWTSEEERIFHEIWGRDNWLLTKHGKNTKYFAKWSMELKECHNIDIKPEEIQQKVNQTRAKFRSVKKNPKFDKQTVTWKKFLVVDKILKNKYRPANADPIPLDALLKNRDVSPSSDMDNDDADPSNEQPPTPNSHASNSQDMSVITPQQQQATSVIMGTDQLNNSSLDDHDISVNLFNANELQPNPDYDYIKQEFAADYSQQATYATQYASDQNHFTPGMTEEPPQLLELQTPQQQQFQSQMQAPQQQQQQTQIIQQQQQQQPQYNNVVVTPTAFDHHSVSNNVGAYAVSSGADAMTLYNNQQQQQQQQQQPHYGTTTMAASVPMPPQTYNSVAQPYMNNNGSMNTNANSISNTTENINSNGSGVVGGGNNGIMQPPRQIPTPQPRKRGRQPGTQMNHTLAVAKTSGADPSLETMYLDEVRKRNVILDEQREIEKKRLHVEERKVSLMEEFFPKCLEMQTKILEKLLDISKPARQTVEPPAGMDAEQ